MAKSKTPDGIWYWHPPYTRREQEWFARLMSRVTEITIVRGPTPPEPPPQEDK